MREIDVMARWFGHVWYHIGTKEGKVMHVLPITRLNINQRRQVVGQISSQTTGISFPYLW